VKEIVVLSGRVGADKTSLVGFLATLARSKVLAAYDVDTAGRIGSPGRWSHCGGALPIPWMPGMEDNPW
jgi:hypothetical protein